MRLKLALPIVAALVIATLVPAALAQPAPARLEPLPLGDVKLLPGTFEDRFEVNRKYVLSLTNQGLLQNYYGEAGMWNPRLLNTMLGGHDRGYYFEDVYWGWESPTCQLRGHFLGHWMSAAAYIAASTGDPVAKARLDQVVDALARVQERNGEGWAASIPQKYFFWMADGISVWAPHYTVHKEFMGLVDAYRYTGNQQALDVANKFSRWFYNWTAQFSRERARRHPRRETGGMLEAWADLYENHRRPNAPRAHEPLHPKPPLRPRCSPAATCSPTSTPTPPSPRPKAPPAATRSPASSAGGISPRPTGRRLSPTAATTRPVDRPLARSGRRPTSSPPASATRTRSIAPFTT